MAVVNAGTVQGLAGMPPVKQIGMMIALAASVALGVAVVLWSQEPPYSVLYGSLDEREASQVIDALQKSGVAYKVDANSGAIMVQSNEIHNARMQLAAEGMPGSVGGGYAMLEGEQGFGTSQFMETARYQHALETELSRTIASLRNVKEARVHLAIPKRSVFLRKQERPTASVVVHLYAGRGLADEHVSAIVNMVASSVPHLAPNDVTVVDQSGNLLTTQDASGMMGMTSTQFAYTRKLEQSYADRIHGLLAPLVGADGVRAEVTADIDFTQVEKTQETFNPDLPALRSEQISEESLAGGAAAVGVPGALTNQPPGGGTTDAGEAGAPAGATGGSSTRRSTRNYELDKTISHTKLATGVVRKLSIAVLVDNKQDETGTAAPWTDEELNKFNALVREAVGFDGTRGDSVQILNVGFKAAPALEPLPEPGLMEQPWIWDVAKQAVGALGVLILFFGVLKPIMRSLAERGQQEQAALAAALKAAEQQEAIAAPGAQPGLPSPPQFTNQIDSAKQLVTEDPKRVAQLMKTWVNEE